MDPVHDAVVVVHSSVGYCSGTLIEAHPDGSGLVLTAGHCVLGGTDFWAAIGDDYAQPDTTRLNVVSAHPHPGYGSILTGNDVALLRVTGVPVGASTLSPLTGAEDHSRTGNGYVVVGYGTIDAAGTVLRTQRRAASVMVHSVYASRLFSSWGDGITCGGDSGGAMIATVDGVERLVAVNVIGDGDCDMTSNAGSERVAYYEDFIASISSGRAPGCTTCVQTHGTTCGEAHSACSADDDCSSYRECLNACFPLDAPCTNACIRLHPGGAAMYGDTLGVCFCGAPCGDVCEVACDGPLVGTLSEEPDGGLADAGLADAGATDASVSSDPGASPAGCSCRARPVHAGRAALTLASLLIVLGARRRAR